MAEGVKKRATRRRIVDAATALFVAEGYGATTLEQIAARADVAVQTIYFHFGNKRTVLKEAVDVASVGDDEPVPLLDRPWMDRLRAETDPGAVVDGWVAASREIVERVGGIMGVVRDAAVVDPEMAEQWAVNEEQRATAFRTFVDLLDARDALRSGLSADEATDIVVAVMSIEVYLLLARRGWTPERWQRWITRTLRTALLSDA
ncbi:TetR/AcrR family transcriptional regulator [Actinomycetospora chibensis]|uniref:TetR/AcrR family transcriptional regulator n=1 Tax=Actinomycetospora chibensis TaxID=663606 RepID=A0ABV9RTK1_9PSEU|nr:TetR/AcrR family transcriptional regulator [Actinomycetospora chibensis]MDD7926400.1 helix-turn-helix domain containing protein [Actinomycetospora chibensis]